MKAVDKESENKPVVVRKWSFSRIGSGIVLIVIGIYLTFRWASWILMGFPRYFVDDLKYWVALGLFYGCGMLLIVSDLKRKKPC